MSAGTKNLFLKIKKTPEPISRPVGPRSKPTVVGPCRRYVGGALTRAGATWRSLRHLRSRAAVVP
jgi:hypothetical protein